MSPEWLMPAALVLIAVALLVQTTVLVTLALQARRMAARAQQLEHEIRTEVQPAMARLNRILANAEEISDRLAPVVPRIEDAVDAAAENIQRANQIFQGVEGVLGFALRPVARALSLLRGVRALTGGPREEPRVLPMGRARH